MEMLLIIGFCMIVLSVLYGISIYLSAIGFLEKKHLPTTIWLFIFATIVGSICSFFASQTYNGIIYISNIYLVLGGITALTLFWKIFCFASIIFRNSTPLMTRIAQRKLLFDYTYYYDITMKTYKIAVAGTGYVGMSIATLLAQHHQVIAVDVIPEKVEKINQRVSPIQDEYNEKYLAEKPKN